MVKGWGGGGELCFFESLSIHTKYILFIHVVRYNISRINGGIHVYHLLTFSAHAREEGYSSHLSFCHSSSVLEDG